jgi:hypothetical protein
LSVDRDRWFAASQVSELFAPAESPATYGFASEDTSSVPPTEVEWYVEVDGERRGPLSLAKLRSLIASGKVADDDLVWRKGFSDWQPAEDFPELFAENADQPSVSVRKRRKTNDAGIWPRILEAIRRSVSEEDLERICRSSLTLGRISMLVGAFGVGTYLTCEAILLDSLATGGFAMLATVMLLALQYVGQRMGEAAHHLARASQYRLSSTAFPYSVAVVLLACGVFISAIGVLSQISRIGEYSQRYGSANDVIPIVISVVVGIEFLLPFLYAFHAALHPKWSNVECDVDVCAGEEGIGCIAYILKVGLRFTPIIYGVSALLGSLGAVAAVALFAAGTQLRRDSFQVLFVSLMSLIAAAIIPSVWYLTSALLSATLDFMAPSLRTSSVNVQQKS